MENYEEDGEFAKEMYKDYILDIYKNPKNYGELKNKTHSSIEYNQFCGDMVEIQLLVKDNIIKDAKFTGKGCVISTVSTSLITEHIKNKSLDYVKKININDIKGLLKINLISSRIKCASLPLNALINSLGQKKDA